MFQVDLAGLVIRNSIAFLSTASFTHVNEKMNDGDLEVIG